MQWWDNLKTSFKLLAIQHSSYLLKNRNRIRAALTNQYILAEKRGNTQNLVRVQNKLKELDIQNLNGSKIRSRVILLDNKKNHHLSSTLRNYQKVTKKILQKL